jgi:uncharacterized OB-fold protein
MSGGESTPAAPAFPRPLPRVDGEAAPFWRALAKGRIELPRCQDCTRFIFYPRSFCPTCLSRDVAWEAVEPSGTVYTFTVVHKPTMPWFAGRAPYVHAIVELACGVRLPTILVGCAPDDVSIGMAVEPVFEKASDEVTLLHFTPRGRG